MRVSTTVRMAPVEHETTLMRGGWDLHTPTIELYPGSLRDVQNFDVSPTIPGGYVRTAGYERYSGQPSPSAATYFFLQLTSFENVPTVGQTLTGQTSAATGYILAVVPTYLILTKIVGSFTNTEVVKVGATTIGTATPTTTIVSRKLNAQYTQLAADNYRTDIAAVPGSGAVRGVVSAIVGGADVVYAFRDNAGATACDLYKSSGAGWVNVPFFLEVSFTAGGATAPADGATLTQGGVTALIKRVMLQSGAWVGSTAAGRFIITSLAGGNFGAGAATIGAVTVTLSGIQTQIVMLPGGKFEFDVANFSGQSSTIRIYGCDGANRGFEFDGETLAPITTGFVPDTPTHVREHLKNLVFAFGSSIGISGPGFPYKWTSVDGAAELACGDVVTNLVVQTGSNTSGALITTTRSDALTLYGSGASTWNLVSLNAGVGGIPFSAQQGNRSYWMAAEGVLDIRAAQEYGNFRQATLTTKIQDFIITQRSKVAYSVLNRTKNQYRILFTDAQALTLTMVNGKFAGATRQLYADAMSCAWSSESSTLNERVFCGAAAGGHVYLMDQGSSFDGDAIDAYLVFNWNHMKQPRIRKRFRRASFEVQSNFYAAFDVGYALGYNNPKISQPSDIEYESNFSGGVDWDSVSWDSFAWDGVTLSPSEVRITGTAENIQFVLRSKTNYIYPFTINSNITHFSWRRGLR